MISDCGFSSDLKSAIRICKSEMKQGPLIIVSGPTAVGKTTVVKQLIKESGLPLRQAVSATTRSKRPGEIDDVHYHFWTPQRFAAGLKSGEFLETATVHGKDSYGTLRCEVDAYRNKGLGVVLVIDVQGAATVRQKCPDAVSIFLTAPLAVLRERIESRGAEDRAAVENRLRTAQAELQRAGEYDHVIVNEDLPRTVAALADLIKGFFVAK
jgi:guanylate kinase